MFNIFKKENILEKITNKNHRRRLVIYFICVFFLALLYNVFFVPYNLVIGGVGGLAIIVKTLTGFSTTLFNNIVTILLLTISFMTIGKKTNKSILGAITYPVMITITEPISHYINIEFNSYLFMVIVACILYGLLYAIIYRIGYNTGGSDILIDIINHYKPMQMGVCSIYMNIGIVVLSGISLGITRVIYGIIALYLSSILTDFFLLGNNDSKMCIVKTKKFKELEKILDEKYEIGYTVLKSAGGIDKLKRTTLFCIVPSEVYYDFRHKVLNIDEKAFMISFNCYEVSGGKRRKRIVIPS